MERKRSIFVALQSKILIPRYKPQGRTPGKKSNRFKNYLSDLQLFGKRLAVKNLRAAQPLPDRCAVDS